MYRDLLGSFVGQLSLVTILLIVIMAVYFIRMFKVWSKRDQALADAQTIKKT